MAGVIAGIGGRGRRGQPAPRGELRLATYRRPQHRAAITVPARPGHPGFGAWPRRTSTVVYGNLTRSFLLEFIGAVTHANRWLLDTPVCFHMVPAPATSSTRSALRSSPALAWQRRQSGSFSSTNATSSVD